ncbi:MAG: T9SS type A sorting domain-containing protein, partial [Ignavibacteria bacterium]
FLLLQNYPNPFNPTTKINFQLTMFNFVSLKVYDILGNEIESLINENISAGSYSIEWNASNYSSGVYFYKLETGSFTDVKRMMLLK